MFRARLAPGALGSLTAVGATWQRMVKRLHRSDIKCTTLAFAEWTDKRVDGCQGPVCGKQSVYHASRSLVNIALSQHRPNNVWASPEFFQQLSRGLGKSEPDQTNAAPQYRDGLRLPNALAVRPYLSHTDRDMLRQSRVIAMHHSSYYGRHDSNLQLNTASRWRQRPSTRGAVELNLHPPRQTVLVKEVPAGRQHARVEGEQRHRAHADHALLAPMPGLHIPIVAGPPTTPHTAAAAAAAPSTGPCESAASCTPTTTCRCTCH